MITFNITGRLIIDQLDIPLSNLVVKAYDKDLFFDDVLGSDTTDKDGRFDILSTTNDFSELFKRNPDIYFKVFDPKTKELVYKSAVYTTINVQEEKPIVIAIPESKMDVLKQPENVRVFDSKGIVLVDENEMDRVDYDPGEDIRIRVARLKAGQTYTVRVSTEGEPLFVSQIMTNQYGQLDNVNIWPQFGLERPRSGERLTIREAREFWSGRPIEIAIAIKDEIIMATEFRVPERFTRPLLVGIDREGYVRNGFVAGEAEARVAIYNPNIEGPALVYMVPRQHNWETGNAFAPITLQKGRNAITELNIDGRSEVYEAVLAEPDQLEPGAYDFIVRPIRYGYEDDEDLTIRPSDLVTRLATGLVVRQDFMESKFALGGCVNTLDISGRSISGSPYFQYTNVFEVGENVYGALDPNALSPSIIGNMVALHVVPHKNAADWTLDNSLNHLPVLGGNNNVPIFKTYSGCINANKRLLWSNAQEGLYDIVADFGNNTSDPQAFVPDHQFDSPPTDFIDGYYQVGFRVVKDPGTETTFSFAGQFQYNDGSHTVLDDLGNSKTADIKAQVYFPADVSGATLPSQLSTVESDYPLVIIIHGNSSATNSYEGYDYLLEHLAKNGFIAASIHMNLGWRATDRARMAFKHIDALNTKFGNPKVQNNVGMMGHSRGGEAVAAAVRLNQQGGLGHNINAIISLAPTDQYTSENVGGAWATPYMNIYGSMDGDVASVHNNGFRLYDRASNAAKSFVFVYGATHGRFNTVWGDTDITAWWSKLGPTDMPKLINMDAHQKIAKAYMTAFFKTHQMGNTKYEELYKGEWIPSSVTTADSGKAKLYLQYQADNTFKMVDNFEGASTGASWQTSTIGGSVDDGNTLPTNPQDNALNSLDNHSPHDTKGALLRWDNSSDYLSFDIPAADKDISGFKAISFRITQKVDSPHNTANAAQDLYLALEDTTNTKRSIRVSKFGVVPAPHKRDKNQYTKSAMNTVRIPLHAYTIKCAGLADVDLSNVLRIRFEFLAKPTGEIEIDSIQFTK